MAGRHLECRQGADIQGADDCQCAVIERKLGLPDRQEYVDHVGLAVVQGVSEAGEHEGAPGVGPVRHNPVWWDDDRLVQNVTLY